MVTQWFTIMSFYNPNRLLLDNLRQLSGRTDNHSLQIWGFIHQVSGQSIQIKGLSAIAALGQTIAVEGHGAEQLKGEIISLEESLLTAMMYGQTEGLKIGNKVFIVKEPSIYPSEDWLGKTFNYIGKTVTGEIPKKGARSVSLKAAPPPAMLRKGLGTRLTTGLAAIDTFLPICKGQRVGLFAGSGVGKSTLLGTLASNTDADVNIVALIGERGREVRHFIEETLGETGMKKSIIFVATSDEPAAVKMRTALLAMATAEYFRDNGQQVLLLFDSLTRFAEAHRDIALSAGEVPSLRAYPPSTFRALAAFCERAGPGLDNVGDISAIFSVLVAGSDMEEPIADMVRGILDGHIILDRNIAERGRYPAINLRQSISRSLPSAATDDENAILISARNYIGRYEDAQTLIQAGLYIAGSDEKLDEAIEYYDAIDEFLSQVENRTIAESFDALSECLVSQKNNVLLQ